MEILCLFFTLCFCSVSQCVRMFFLSSSSSFSSSHCLQQPPRMSCHPTTSLPLSPPPCQTCRSNLSMVWLNRRNIFGLSTHEISPCRSGCTCDPAVALSSFPPEKKTSIDWLIICEKGSKDQRTIILSSLGFFWEEGEGILFSLKTF